jgi:hypothetical protein
MTIDRLVLFSFLVMLVAMVVALATGRFAPRVSAWFWLLAKASMGSLFLWFATTVAQDGSFRRSYRRPASDLVHASSEPFLFWGFVIFFGLVGAALVVASLVAAWKASASRYEYSKRNR